MDNDRLDDAACKIFKVVAVYLAKFPDAGPSQLMKDLPEFNELADHLALYTDAAEASKNINQSLIEIISLATIQQEAKDTWNEFQKVLHG